MRRTTTYLFALAAIVAPSHATAEPTLADLLYQILSQRPIASTPGDTETREEQLERLREIADHAALVGKDANSALLILAVMEHESGFNQTVDRGPCWRGKDGRGSQCDSGQAACGLQLHGTPEDRADYFRDRRLCFKAGLRALRSSQGLCTPQVGAEHAFAAYAAGNCMNPDGQRGSRELVAYWGRWQGYYASAKAKAVESEDAGKSAP